MKRVLLSLFLILGSLVMLNPVSSQAQVNPNRISQPLISESVKAVLGTDKKIEWHHIPVSDKIRVKVREKLKLKSGVVDTLFLGRVATNDGVQFILPDIAPSRSEKFSYLLYFDSTKKITGVDVLEYRENYGYEIDYSYFRDQFKDKTEPENIIFGRSIQNISGATISARSLTHSIHDLMLVINKVELP